MNHMMQPLDAIANRLPHILIVAGCIWLVLVGSAALVGRFHGRPVGSTLIKGGWIWMVFVAVAAVVGCVYVLVAAFNAAAGERDGPLYAFVIIMLGLVAVMMGAVISTIPGLIPLAIGGILGLSEKTPYTCRNAELAIAQRIAREQAIPSPARNVSRSRTVNRIPAIVSLVFVFLVVISMGSFMLQKHNREQREAKKKEEDQVMKFAEKNRRVMLIVGGIPEHPFMQ